MLTCQVEVWALTATKEQISSLSGEHPLLSHILDDGSDPFDASELLLEQHSISTQQLELLHSTSWRVEGGVRLTFVALVHRSHPSLRLEGVRGISISEASSDESPHVIFGRVPVTDSQVLLHALRHLRFLIDTDDQVSSALDDYWRQHLRHVFPVVAGQLGRKLIFEQS